MNAFTKQSLVRRAPLLGAALVLAGVVAAPAAASVQSDVQQSISSGNVNVTLTDGVATLTGYTDNVSRIAALRAAAESPDVTSVINLLERS